MNKKYEKLIRQAQWHYPQAGNCWQDGMFLGNGNIGALSYAPQHLEWVFNKVDVFDPTVEEAMSEKILPHRRVMELLKQQKHKNSMFLRELESAPHGTLQHPQYHKCSKNAAAFLARFGLGGASGTLDRPNTFAV